MKRLIFLTLIMSAPLAASSAGIVDTFKKKLRIAGCVAKNTEQMCMFEEIFRTSPKMTLKKDFVVKGISGAYILRSPNAKWNLMWPESKKRKEDMVLMEQSGHAFIQVDWSDKKGDYDSVAKKALRELMDKFNTQPSKVDLQVWPYKNNGVVYEMCYSTNKKTQECMYSAAANLGDGLISFYSITAYEKSLIDDVVYIIASVDVPKSVK